MNGPSSRRRITLKLATSLDGRIATATGESRWITGAQAREAVHRLRSEHDAVLIGIETALADDPDLTVRLEGYAGRQPARVVLDSRQRLPTDGRLAASARNIPVYLVTTGPPSAAIEAAGVKVLRVPADEARPDLDSAVRALAAEGFERLLVEGGGQVAAAFLRAGLVDAVEWFRAPILLGAEGRPGLGPLGLDRLADAPRLRRTCVVALGEDLWERYERA